MKSEDLAAFKNDVAYNRLRFNAKHAILIFYGYENQLQMKVYKITQNLNNFVECLQSAWWDTKCWEYKDE